MLFKLDRSTVDPTDVNPKQKPFQECAHNKGILLSQTLQADTDGEQIARGTCQDFVLLKKHVLIMQVHF